MACCALPVFGATSVPVGVQTQREDLESHAVYDRPWQLRSFVEQAGLAGQRIFDIAFAPDGTVLVAAADGLYSFDGHEWRRFGPREGLPSAFVRCVLVTRSGELWVGSDAGAGVYDPASGRYDPRGTQDGLPNSNVRRIFEDPDGTLWFCCDLWPETSGKQGGLARLRAGKFTVYTTRDGLPMDYVIAYHLDRSGRRYAMTPQGWVMSRGESWISASSPVASQEPCVHHVAEAPDGALFMQGDTTVLLGRGEVYKDLGYTSSAIGSLRSGAIVAVQRDPVKGLAWLSQWDGQKFKRASAAVPCPPNPRFYRVAEAPDGSVWVVGTGTLLRWACKADNWTLYPDLPNPKLRDAFGRIWLSGGGAVYWLELGELNRLKGVDSLFGVDKDGTVLASLAGGRGAVLYSPGRSTQAEPLPSSLGEPLRSISDDQGRLWLASRSSEGALLVSNRDASA